MNWNGYIENLPRDCCVEVPMFVDKNGLQPVHVGALPAQCAALNMMDINVQPWPPRQPSRRRGEADDGGSRWIPHLCGADPAGDP